VCDAFPNVRRERKLLRSARQRKEASADQLMNSFGARCDGKYRTGPHRLRVMQVNGPEGNAEALTQKKHFGWKGTPMRRS
jgi:hypothetical protein